MKAETRFEAVPFPRKAPWPCGVIFYTDTDHRRSRKIKKGQRFRRPFSLVEHTGFEPVTPTLPVLCAPNCANAPLLPFNYTLSPGVCQPYFFAPFRAKFNARQILTDFPNILSDSFPTSTAEGATGFVSVHISRRTDRTIS